VIDVVVSGDVEPAASALRHFIDRWYPSG